MRDTIAMTFSLSVYVFAYGAYVLAILNAA